MCVQIEYYRKTVVDKNEKAKPVKGRICCSISTSPVKTQKKQAENQSAAGESASAEIKRGSLIFIIDILVNVFRVLMNEQSAVTYELM